MTRGAALLVLAAALAGCGTVANRDPRNDTRYVAIKDRVDDDRAEIDRQVKTMNEPDPAARAARLERLDAALSKLFRVQSQAYEASAEGDPGAIFAAESMLDQVETSIGLVSPKR
jgi:hypothetical protein